MRDPVTLGDMTIDRAEIAAVLPQGNKLLVWIKGSGSPIMLQNTFSRDEIAALAPKTEHDGV